jgi:hypothetical protein
LILDAGEAIVNVAIDAFNAIFVAAVLLLPALPEELAPPAQIAYVNWFFPVSGALTVATGLLGGYVTFLAIRWVFRKTGAM